MIHHRPASPSIARRLLRGALAAAIAFAGFVAVPETGFASVVITCDDPATPNPAVNCNGTTVSLTSPNRGPGIRTIGPARLYDSRAKNERLPAGGVATVVAAGVGGVPSNATAVMANIAVVGPNGPGHLTAYPCDRARPDTAMLTYIAGETRSGSTLVQLDPAGRLCVYSRAGADVVVDVQGYVADSSSPETFNPVRVFDTRNAKPINGGIRLKMSELPGIVAINGNADLNGITGLWLNVTAVLAPAAGYVTVERAGGFSDPYAPTARLNYDAVRAQTNLMYVRLYQGEAWLATSNTAHLIIDVVGLSRHPDSLVAVDIIRELDTRSGGSSSGRLQPGVPVEVNVADDFQGVTPTAVLVNLAVVNPSAQTHVTVYPCGSRVPDVANANVGARATVSNAALVPVGANGKICVVSVAATDVVVDLAAMATTTVVGSAFCTLIGSPSEWGSLSGGVPPYTLSGTLPDGVTAEYTADGRFQIVPPADSKMSINRQLVITDAAGNQTPFIVHWYEGFKIPGPVC